jgi:hypothetical protein
MRGREASYFSLLPSYNAAATVKMIRVCSFASSVLLCCSLSRLSFYWYTFLPLLLCCLAIQQRFKSEEKVGQVGAQRR